MRFRAGLVTFIFVAAGFGCGDPELVSELDSTGPPEIMSVSLRTDSTFTFVPTIGEVNEAPLFCSDRGKINEIMCPEGIEAGPLDDALPVGWHVRIAFSELLDPDVEDLVDTDGDGIVDAGSLAETQPVELSCAGTPVAYDGFYDPTGSHLTFPPGPALVIQALDFVATGTTDCEVTLTGDVTDKSGNAVPDSEPKGPHMFGIAPLRPTGLTDPPDMSEGVDPDTTEPIISFNAPIDVATLAGQITLNDGAADVAITPELDPLDPTAVVLVPDAGMLAPDTTYTVTIAVAATIADEAGGPLVLDEPFEFSFTTGN